MTLFRQQKIVISFWLMKNGSMAIHAVNAEIIITAKGKNLFQGGAPAANMTNQQRRTRPFMTAGCRLPMLFGSCIPSVVIRIFQLIKLPRMNVSAK